MKYTRNLQAIDRAQSAAVVVEIAVLAHHSQNALLLSLCHNLAPNEKSTALFQYTESHTLRFVVVSKKIHIFLYKIIIVDLFLLLKVQI